MKIGIIGAGNIGGTLGQLLLAAGHSVFFGVRHPEAVMADGKQAGTPADAVAFGDCLVFAGPYGAWPAFAAMAQPFLDGKIVIDAANPYPARDGEVARQAIDQGASALFTQSLLPGARLVKTFNSIYWVDLRDRAHVAMPRLAMPIAADDARARQLAEQLATDTGFDPLLVGGLAQSGVLDPGGVLYAKSYSAEGARRALQMAPSSRGTGAMA